MDLKKLTPAAVAMTLALGSTGRADAQDRNRDNRSHSREDTVRSHDQRGSDRAVARGNDNARARDDAQAREQAQAQAQARDQARARDQAVARDRAVARDQARSRAESNARASDNRGRSYDNRAYDNRSRAYDHRAWNDGRRYGSSVRIVPRYQRIVPYRIYQPRPYRSGFSPGIFFGRPYPYRYAYPYPVPAYGYPIVAPGAAYGGISFGINPGDADVYVDGEYVGPARDFDGAAPPLTLSAGMHRIEMQAPGFEPLVFDVNVVPGQVMPYQGGMQPRY